MCWNATPRPRVTALLNRLIREHRAVVVAAAEGSGKTTAMRHWQAQCDAPVAWLTLGPAHGHQPTFLHDLIEALRTVYPTLPAASHDLQAGARVHVLAESIVHQVAEPLADRTERTVLVLDNVDNLHDTAFAQGLLTLARVGPPGLHIVLILHGLLPVQLAHERDTFYEVHVDTLSLTIDELAQTLQREGVPLDSRFHGVASELLRTAGLAQLFRMAVQLGAYGPDLLKRGAKYRTQLDVWLMGQVLARLPARQVTLLHAACLLGEFDDDCAAQVLDDHDVNDSISALLELGALRRTPNKQLVLRGGLHVAMHASESDSKTQLHRKIAYYMHANGRAQAFVHAMHSDAVKLAGDVLGTHGLRMCLQGQVDRVGGWLVRLPTEVRLERIDCGLVSLFTSALRCRGQQSEQHLHIFREALRGSVRRMHAGERFVYQLVLGWMAYRRGQWDHALGHGFHALRFADEAAHLPGMHRPVFGQLTRRSLRLRADALTQLGCHADAIATLRRLLHISESSGDVAEALLARARIAKVHRAQGRLDLALQGASQVQELAAEQGLYLGHAEGFARHVRSLVLLDRYEPYSMLEEAERAWALCFLDPHAQDRNDLNDTLAVMRRATDAIQTPPPIPAIDISTLVELPEQDVELMNRYAYGLNHWEVSGTIGTSGADTRWRIFGIERALGATSRSQVVQFLRAAGRVTYYPSLTMH